MPLAETSNKETLVDPPMPLAGAIAVKLHEAVPFLRNMYLLRHPTEIRKLILEWKCLQILRKMTLSGIWYLSANVELLGDFGSKSYIAKTS